MKFRTLIVVAMSLSLPLIARAQMRTHITKSQAEQAALASVNGGKVLSAEYETEGSRHVWSLDVQKDGYIKEIWVDPVSGMVIKIQNTTNRSENPKGSGGMMMPKSQLHGTHKTAHKSGITKKAAEQLALRAVQGEKVLEARKVRRDLIVVWSVDVKTSKGTQDVWISPENGKVLKVSGNAGGRTMNKN